jgi:hypothetical protein
MNMKLLFSDGLKVGGRKICNFICILIEILQSLIVHFKSEVNLYIPYATLATWRLE